MAYKHDDLLYQAMKSQTKRFLIARLIPGSNIKHPSSVLCARGRGKLEKIAKTSNSLMHSHSLNVLKIIRVLFLRAAVVPTILFILKWLYDFIAERALMGEQLHAIYPWNLSA